MRGATLITSAAPQPAGTGTSVAVHPRAGVGVSYVQSVSKTESTSGTATNIALAGAVAVNSILVAFAFWNSTTATCVLTDDQGNRWVPVDAPQTGAGGLSAFRVQAFWCPAPKAAIPNLTMSTSATTTSRGVAVVEYAHALLDGLELLDDFDHSSLFSAAGTPSTGTVWAKVNALVVACCVASDQVLTPGTGYTQRERANFANNSVEDKTASADALTAAGFNTTTNNDVILWVLVFRSRRRRIARRAGRVR